MIDTITTIGIYILLVASGFGIGYLYAGLQKYWERVDYFNKRLLELNKLVKEKESKLSEIEKDTETQIKLTKEIAEKEANKIKRQILQEAKKIKEQEYENARQEWLKAHRTLQEATNILETIKTCKEIMRKKKWKYLQRLALAEVPKARVKEEMIKANRILIYLDDLYKDLKNRIEMEEIELPPMPVDESELNQPFHHRTNKHSTTPSP